MKCIDLIGYMVQLMRIGGDTVILRFVKRNFVIILPSILVLLLLFLLFVRPLVFDVLQGDTDNEESTEYWEFTEYLDPYFGDFYDLILSSVEDNKPDFFKNIFFNMMRYPSSERISSYYPAFLMAGAESFIQFPSEIWNQYFTDDYVEKVLNMYEDLGSDFFYPSSDIFLYEDIYVEEVVFDKYYHVTYLVPGNSYVYSFEKDGNKFRRISPIAIQGE